MPLVPATLGSELESMEPTEDEQVAIDRFCAAWETYFEGAMAGPVPVTPGSLAGAIASMKGPMAGMSGDGQGAAKIQAGITQFWVTVAGAAASIWPASTAATPPPGLAGIAAAVGGAFAANAASSADLPASCQTIATALHGTQAGGIAIFPPPPGGIGPQTIL